jgi:hypothetical protein
MAIAAAAFGLGSCAHVTASAPAITVPFDDHSNQVRIAATSNGMPLRMLVDTAVDPSAVDRSLAPSLGLSRIGDEGAVSGVGKDSATAYESVFAHLAIGGHDYGPIPVLVADLSKLQARFGEQMDGILGYSLLKDHAVLIDYPANRITIYDGAAEEPRRCGKAHRFPLQFQSADEKLILVPGLTIGGVEIPAFLDTGSSGGLRIEDAAPGVASVRPLLPAGTAGTSVGARGQETLRNGVLTAPVGLGPFQIDKTDVALVDSTNPAIPINIGNRFLRALGVKVLVDIPHQRVGFYGECR